MARPEAHQKGTKSNKRDHVESRELLDKHKAQRQLDHSSLDYNQA